MMYIILVRVEYIKNSLIIIFSLCLYSVSDFMRARIYIENKKLKSSNNKRAKCKKNISVSKHNINDNIIHKKLAR